MDATQIYTTVTSRYSATANSSTSSSHACTVARAFGYSASELASIPADSNLGLSCGNPLALTSLKSGETVIDLGCGAGFDAFLAARKVGEKGRVVGVDMNEDMLSKARLNASKASITNVEFVKSKITAIDLQEGESDVIISNCVINLVPSSEKNLVFKEMHRLLRPGGRVAVSDILIKKPLPEELKRNVALYVGCVAGASSKEEYEGWLKEAGFEDVVVVDAGSDLNVYTREEVEGEGCCGQGKVEKKCCGEDGGVAADMKKDLRHVDLNEWAGKCLPH
jgi:arsenite methyltransferase